MKTARRWLYLMHRWLGIATCVLALLWFVSGLVMMYVPYPSITRAERVSALAPIAWDQVKVQPTAALVAAGVQQFPREFRLEMQGLHPVYRMTDANRTRLTVSAFDGQLLRPADSNTAKNLASAFGSAPAVGVERINRDQWTVAQGFDPSRPLWRVRLADGRGSDVYVGGPTGEVVQHTTAWERGWNWVGAVPHWLYLTAIRQNGDIWRQVVMWTSGPAVIVGLTGLWVGLLRWRASRKRRIPYREPWMRWHHIFGLIGGVTMLTWMASGWLSVNPFGWFNRSGDPAIEQHYAGDVRPLFAPLSIDRLGEAAPGARQMRFVHVGGTPRVLAIDERMQELALDARTFQPVVINRASVIALAHRAAAGKSLERVDLLTSPDVYWYSHWSERPLPVWRVRFSDVAATWLHIDARTGMLLGQSTAEARTYRWLFNFLHDFDLPILLAHRWLRDPLMWVLLGFGTVMSVTGVVIGWRRLRRPRAAAKRAATADRGWPSGNLVKNWMDRAQ